MRVDLTGRTALITGASRGVGRAAALALSEAGASCILLARDAQALDEVVAACPGPARALVADLADPQAVADAITPEAPRVDLFVHAAAPWFPYEKLHQLSPATLERHLRVSAGSAAQISAALLPELMLKRWGRVVLISSLGGRLGGAGASAYNMGKAALESLARSIALEYGRYHICANVLCLGPVDGDRLARRDAEHPGARDALLARTPSRRLPTEAQVADLIVMFCSEQIAPVQGATLDVSAGTHLNTAW